MPFILLYFEVRARVRVGLKGLEHGFWYAQYKSYLVRDAAWLYYNAIHEYIYIRSTWCESQVFSMPY